MVCVATLVARDTIFVVLAIALVDTERSRRHFRGSGWHSCGFCCRSNNSSHKTLGRVSPAEDRTTQFAKESQFLAQRPQEGAALLSVRTGKLLMEARMEAGLDGAADEI